MSTRRTLVLPMPDRHLPWNLAQSRAELRADLAMVSIAHRGQLAGGGADADDDSTDYAWQDVHVDGSERPYRPTTARERFARGVDTLWNEQCHEWAVQHAYNDRVGAFSLARMERRAFGRRIMRGLRAEVDLAERFAIAERHAEAYPSAYTAAMLDTRDAADACAVYRSWARSDVLPWNVDDCAAHEMTGREPAHARLLERAADVYLRHADLSEHHEATVDALLAGKPGHVPDRPDPWPRLDVIDRWTKRPTVTPDRVAFRGVARVRQPSPVRYETARPVSVDSADPIIASATIGIPPRTVLEYRTVRIGMGFAWHGHRRVTLVDRETRRAVKRKVVRAETRAARADGADVARRGPIVKPWSLADRSLTRRWAKADAGQRAAADTLAAILVTSTRGVVLNLGERFHAVTPDGTTVYLADEHGSPRTRTFTLQAFARRAALAREDIA